MRPLLLATTALIMTLTPAFAEEDVPVPPRKPLEARTELNVRAGSDRSILMNEYWVPFYQTSDGVGTDSVVYGDLRLMGDDQDNNEFNAGIGYRKMVRDIPLLGDGVVGMHGWFDRRHTERGAKFNQITAGAEWYSKVIDLKLNAYMPLNKAKTYMQANATPSANGFVGNQIVVSTNQIVQEEAMAGLDLELGWNVPLEKMGIDFTDTTRVYAGAYHFAGDKAEDVTGWRARIASDITQDIQLGARFQKDDVRGSQGFLEATIRFPFGNKKSYRDHGLYARLDESPERDIDIVTSPAIVQAGENEVLLNAATGTAQKVIHVDNTNGAAGEGTVENPYNTLTAAQNASNAHDIIYVHEGLGSNGMSDGILLDKTGQMLVGAGTSLLFDGTRFGTANGLGLSNSVLIAGTAAPTITNLNPGGAGVTVRADNIYLAGFNITGASGDGILVDANNLSAQNITIRDISANNNGRMGLYLHGYNNGSLSALVERTATTGNAQHGMAIYDDTSATFDVDLGGGGKSSGNNALFGNTLEDLAIDYDGRAFFAQNNWWGQASGLYQAAPNAGLKPQIYYGAPINDGLVGHWTFDTEWMGTTTAYDRSGNNNHGTLQGGLSSLDIVKDAEGQSLNFNGSTHYIDINTTLNLTPNFSIVTDFMGRTGDGWDCHSPVILSKKSLGSCGGSSWGIGYTDHPAAASYQKKVLSLWGNGTWVQDRTVAQIEFGEWGHFAWTRNGTNGISETYVDNIHDRTIDTSAMILTNTQMLRMGKSTNSTFFDGMLNDIRMYNRTLDPSEIAELYRMDTTSVVDFSSFRTVAP